MADTDVNETEKWPSKLEDGDRLFAIVDGSSGEVPYLIFSSKERKASYARDAGGWHLVGESFFEKLEDRPLYYVESVTIDAIDAYDTADMNRTTPSILDLSAPGKLKITAAASRPAPKKDRIYGSKVNKPGSAAGGKKITFSDKTEEALKNKVKEHNEKAPEGRKATLAMLKAVYRRGAGAYSSSHRPGKTRDQWAMARVNAYLRLLKSGRPTNPNYKQDNDLLPSSHPKASNSSETVIAAAESSAEDGTCPPATTDIALNLKNRRKAIRTANYGPLNPEEPNEAYWKERAAVWSVSIEEAKNSTCSNCAMFSITTKMRQCIADGIASGGSGQTDAWDAIDQAELGYCEAFDFKCAASRTCDAWVTGGPITDESQGEKEAQ